MDQRNPGRRYLELARRCRAKAACAFTDGAKTGLMRLADAYDRRADELASPVADRNWADFDNAG